MLPDRENMTRHDQQICDVIDLVPNTVCDTDVLLAVIGALDGLLDCRKEETAPQELTFQAVRDAVNSKPKATLQLG